MLVHGRLNTTEGAPLLQPEGAPLLQPAYIHQLPPHPSSLKGSISPVSLSKRPSLPHHVANYFLPDGDSHPCTVVVH